MGPESISASTPSCPPAAAHDDTKWFRWSCLIATFVASFLLFQLQPMIGKMLLPWFGGTAGVWNICLLFFQTMLFGGYLYAHWITTRVRMELQLLLHIALVIGALVALPIVPDPTWKPSHSDPPIRTVLMILARSAGVPFFLLSTTAPWLQRAWIRVVPSSPYRLYALSNIGSLAALLSYPFVAEWWLGTTRQAELWSWGFVVLAALLLVCQFLLWRTCNRHVAEAVAPAMIDGETHLAEIPTRQPTVPRASALWQPARWLLLAALGTTFLAAVTNYLCQDVTSVPFLWIGPLSLYLLSFIVCFGKSSWYRRQWAIPLMLLFSFGGAISYVRLEQIRLLPSLAMNLAALFTACLVCHGELERLKPDARYLTSYYAYLAAGGMTGGLFVGVVAPQLFKDFYELPLAMIASWLIGLTLVYRSPRSPLNRGKQLWAWLLLLIAFAMNIALWSGGLVGHRAALLWIERNFYGVLKVVEMRLAGSPRDRYLALIDGQVEHGGQFENDVRRSLSVSYYGSKTGVGRAFEMLNGRSTLHIGVVGLGTGTVGAYARPGDRFRFYEINPAVVSAAQERFTYFKHLQRTGATHHVIVGDGRLSLEAEPPQAFDLLIIDAFTGDSIPMHLLTREAADVYLRHLRSEGILAIHVTNRFLDLTPVTRGIAIAHQLESAQITATVDNGRRPFTCTWVLLTRAEHPPSSHRSTLPTDGPIDFTPADALPGSKTFWTDDQSSLLQVIKGPGFLSRSRQAETREEENNPNPVAPTNASR